MLTPKFGILLCAVCAFWAAGCDPVRTTLQHVTLQITNSASEQPVAWAQVSMKHDYDEEWREIWNALPWSCGLTDKDGQTVIGIEYTVLDRTIWSKPPSWRDDVSGEYYLVTVKEGQVQEIFTIMMRPGSSIHGKSFTVSVLEIRKPRYVKTE